MMSAGRVQWRGPLKICGNFDYIAGYWEWAEDVLSRCGDMLSNTSLTGAVQASLCVYDCSDKFLKAFCKNWFPSTNTLIIPQGQSSISLWDLLELGGTSVTGHFFDKLVPTIKYLSQSLSDKARIPESCRFLLLDYHYLAAQSPDGRVSISAWIGFWSDSLRSYMGYEATNRSTSKVASLNVYACTLSVIEQRP
ncbi:hypothetical protein LIER_40600 [Lithospermum erythrorhizon]|uniref:Aminotransferase-like plant mobile domain-containing protein n=1 Tax=Lithospermum erythrorhizon TaxID=34254 RepID=A0AAV3QX33_LITER